MHHPGAGYLIVYPSPTDNTRREAAPRPEMHLGLRVIISRAAHVPGSS